MGRGIGIENREVVSGAAADFAGLVPVREDYARVDVRDGFDWRGSVGRVAGFRAYLVVFRSVRKETADIGVLVSHDDNAHDEAMKSAGFMHYFKGNVAGDRYCLSFCLWETREYARLAARGVFHQLAVGITAEMYDTYDLERYYVYLEGGEVVFRPVSPAG